MQCSVCHRLMRPLFISFACDYCDGLKTDATRHDVGYVVWRKLWDVLRDQFGRVVWRQLRQ